MVGNSQSVSTTFERRAKRSPLARALTPAESDVVTATSSASALTRPANAARADSCRSTQYSHGAPYSSQSARYCSYDARTASERAPCEQELMYTRCSKIGKRFRQRAGTSVMASVVTFPILGADCGRIVTLPRHRGSDPALSDAARAVDEASHFRDTEGQTLRFRTRPALWTKSRKGRGLTPAFRSAPQIRFAQVLVLEQLAGAALEDQPDRREDIAAVGDRQRHVRVLLHDQHGDPRLVDLLDDLEAPLDEDRREPHRRLVHEQKLRLRHQRAAHRDHLLLAARESPGQLAPPLVQ